MAPPGAAEGIPRVAAVHTGFLKKACVLKWCMEGSDADHSEW